MLPRSRICESSLKTEPMGKSNIVLNELKWRVYLMLASVVIVVVYLIINGSGGVCAFKQATGIPCPMCGGTRAVRCLLKLDFVGTWSYNPYVYALVLWIPTYAICWKKKLYIACVTSSVANILFLFGSYAIRYFNGTLFSL